MFCGLQSTTLSLEEEGNKGLLVFFFFFGLGIRVELEEKLFPRFQ